VVSLNRAVAAAMVHGPSEGLRLLEPLEQRLAGHHRLDAVRAHLFDLAGDRETVVRYYRAAADRTASTPEKHYLTIRAARLRATLDAAGAGSPAPGPSAGRPQVPVPDPPEGTAGAMSM
jgi:predicted RNA polymerase sigma factor